jgi:hypothetical protein
MLTDNQKYKEEGFIGDEIFQTREQETAHLCRIVQSTVERKVFTLDEALAAYEVSLKDYELYLAKNFYNELQGTSNGLSDTDSALTYIHVTMNFLNMRFEHDHSKDFEKVFTELSRISKKIEKKKPSLHKAE